MKPLQETIRSQTDVPKHQRHASSTHGSTAVTALTLISLILTPHLRADFDGGVGIGSPPGLEIETAHALPDYDKLMLAGDSFSRRFGNAFAAGDFNEDGRLDIIAHIHGPDPANRQFAARVYLQGTNGTFNAKPEQPLPNIGFTSFLFRTGDFNEDGHLDVLMDDVGNDLVLILGKGDGTFREPIVLGLGVSGFFATADLNGDKHLDFVAGNTDGSGTAAVFLGAGDATFTPKATLDTVVQPFFPPRGELMISDLNRDGKLDITVASPPANNDDSGNLDVFFGNGDGTFQPVIRTEAVATRRGALGDFNGDGIPDFAGDRSSPMQVEIWLGKGDGHFFKNKAYSLAFTLDAWAVKVADVNGDGILDVLVAGEPLSPLSIFLGKGDGTFQSRQSFSAVGAYQPINEAPLIVDLNGDGYPDLVGLAENVTASPEEILAIAMSKGAKRDPTGGFLINLTDPKSTATAGPLLLETTANFIDWTTVATNSASWLPLPWRVYDSSGGLRHRFYRIQRPQ